MFIHPAFLTVFKPLTMGTVRVNPPLVPGAPMLSNPDLTKLYMSTAGCPELKAESVISSDEEGEAFLHQLEIFEPPMEMHDVSTAAMLLTDTVSPEQLAEEPYAEVRSLVEHSVSSPSSTSSDKSNRRKLQWEFKGLTLWLELEEFDSDITRAVEDLSSKRSSPFIPKPHTTAIYGMDHLTVDEAKARLARVKDEVGMWPSFARPTGLTSDVAVCGRPGQVCSIAWSELTLATNPDHEQALDKLYQLFYGDEYVRDRPWKPHNSIAYDNPETNELSLLDAVMFASENPSLLGRERRVEAISLWSTEGRMDEWECLDRVRFW